MTKSKPQLLQLVVEEERVASSSDRACSDVNDIPIENEENRVGRTQTRCRYRVGDRVGARVECAAGGAPQRLGARQAQV